MIWPHTGSYSPGRSVSRFQEKEKRGEMITLNDNINDDTHPVQGKMITQK
jgi:hypothetical protein